MGECTYYYTRSQKREEVARCRTCVSSRSHICVRQSSTVLGACCPYQGGISNDLCRAQRRAGLRCAAAQGVACRTTGSCTSFHDALTPENEREPCEWILQAPSECLQRHAALTPGDQRLRIDLGDCRMGEKNLESCPWRNESIASATAICSRDGRRLAEPQSRAVLRDI